MLKELEVLAKAESRTKSELLREALREYMGRRKWRSLQRYGRMQAKKKGITEADVEKIIEEFREEVS
ncbi:MAG: ribbon-helix-helix protein, CopG family [Actinobacteria bacterium]|nr:ribbon-helix-helix protein, CopG family [Actinomycetota bacterium]